MHSENKKGPPLLSKKKTLHGKESGLYEGGEEENIDLSVSSDSQEDAELLRRRDIDHVSYLKQQGLSE